MVIVRISRPGTHASDWESDLLQLLSQDHRAEIELAGPPSGLEDRSPEEIAARITGRAAVIVALIAAIAQYWTNREAPVDEPKPTEIHVTTSTGTRSIYQITPFNGPSDPAEFDGQSKIMIRVQ
jgi:hypothetical protein